MSPSTHASLTRLEEIAGGEHVSTAEADLRAREVCGVTPSIVVRPANAEQVSEILRFAAAEELAVIPMGAGTKLGLGAMPARYDIALDLARMNRVLAYDPHDLTLGVEPGLRIQDLLPTLAEQKQFLPLGVPFLDRATLGGIVASNSSSPMRHAYGAARDFCLGMEFVTGEGTRAKSGGRVVKNVTGYDLHKLLIGSLGTLAVITRVNFRTFPLLPEQGTFAATFQTAEQASDFCLRVSHSALAPQILEIANPAAARILFARGASGEGSGESWCVVVSVAAQAAVVDRHTRELSTIAQAASAREFTALGESDSATLLARLREYPRLVRESMPSALIFRVNIVPAAIPSTLKRLGEFAGARGFAFAALGRACGILNAVFTPESATSASPAACAQLAKDVLQVNAAPEAHAQVVLEFCPAEVKCMAGDPWGPPRADLPLMRKVKDSFDPQHVLSPGRFAGGI
jgi:glycolate oxidase FAD binding subunit